MEELIRVLTEARALLALPGNNFFWSPWDDQAESLAEMDKLLNDLNAGKLPDRLSMFHLFAPTGPIQEVSLSSGWGDDFLAVAKRFDTALANLPAGKS